MDINNPITAQYVAGAGCTLVGLLGWFVPFQWNPLRLRGKMAALFPEKVNRLIPKIMGTILIVCGLVTILVTATGGKGN